MAENDKPAEETAPETTKAPAGPRTSLAPKGLLSHDSDAPARPGFRGPPNKNSHAQMTKKKKK
jgi:hypothetical protein